MKAVLVPVEMHDRLRSVLETALLLARRFGSLLEGFALRPIMTEFVPVDMVGGLTWTQDDLVDPEEARRAREAFEAFMHEREVPVFAEGHEGPVHRWFDADSPGDAAVGECGRVFDLTVVGRPISGQIAPRMSTLEAALFESGRPILIAPPDPPRSLGDTVVVAWNGSTETALTVALSMPFLQQAREVIVVTVGPQHMPEPGPTGEELARGLEGHGFSVSMRTAVGRQKPQGESFLREAMAAGADLMLKGAYTQSRIRQMIFGGATRHIIMDSRIPVIMAR